MVRIDTTLRSWTQTFYQKVEAHKPVVIAVSLIGIAILVVTTIVIYTSKNPVRASLSSPTINNSKSILSTKMDALIDLVGKDPVLNSRVNEYKKKQPNGTQPDHYDPNTYVQYDPFWLIMNDEDKRVLNEVKGGDKPFKIFTAQRVTICMHKSPEIWIDCVTELMDTPPINSLLTAEGLNYDKKLYIRVKTVINLLERLILQKINQFGLSSEYQNALFALYCSPSSFVGE